MADISSQLSALGNAYNDAMSKGNTSLAAQYHDTANQLRSQNGQSTYYDSNTDPAQSSTSSGSSNPGTGTTGTTSSGSIAGQMLSAAQNPQVTHWNFGNGQTLNTNVGGSNTSYNGRSVTSMSNLASTLGINYTKDPNTGALKVNGQIVNPVGYDSTGAPIVQVRQVLNAAGVPDENIKYDANTGNVSVTMPQEQQAPYQQAPYPQVPYMQPMQLPSYSSMVGAQPQMSQYINPTPYQAPDLSMYLNNLTPTNLSPFTPDWNTYMQQAHNVYDPTANADIQQLMTKENQDISSADEKMNARGIFNSGLAQANEDLIRGNSSNAVAKVIASSQSNIAKMAQSLYTDAFDQWSKGNSLALQNNQMWLNQAMNAEKQAYTEWLGGQNLNLNQYKAALDAWNNAASNALKYAQMQVTNQQSYDKMNQTATSDNATNALKYNQMMLPYTMGPTPQQQIQNSLDLSKVSGFMPNGSPTLDTFKSLGYVQMPDGSLKPTEQATMDKQNTAIKWAQTLGYTVDSSGKIIPTQQANYQNAQIQLDNNKLTAQIHQWAADNQLKSAQIGLDQQKLDEKSQYDQAMIDKASQSAQNDTQKTQLEALKSQMISVTDQIKTYQAAGKTPPDDLVNRYNTIMTNVDKVAGTNSSNTSTLDAGFPLQGTPSGSFSNFQGLQ